MQPESNPFSEVKRADLLQEMKSSKWVHVIEVGGGVETPGGWGKNPNPLLNESLASINYDGKKVLDIGCWDGVYSFQAEQGGAAEVYATDLLGGRHNTENQTFQIASALRGSKAKYFPDLSVYNVSDLNVSDFDVVLFLGVYYHLKDPLLALESLRRVMKLGATIVIEGEVSLEQGCHANFYHREAFVGDGSNWWVPTVQCLREWVEASGFEIKKEYGGWGGPHSARHVIVATASIGITAAMPTKPYSANNLESRQTAEIIQLQRIVSDIKASTSWRLTAPIRAVKGLFSR